MMGTTSARCLWILLLFAAAPLTLPSGHSPVNKYISQDESFELSIP
jgi:hypothetical protein